MLRKLLDQVAKNFEEGKPLAFMYPLFEATDSFLFTPGTLAKKAPFVHDAVDMKRVMVAVIIALIPATIFGVYNVGYQILLAQGVAPSLIESFVQGSWKVIPIIAVSYAAGGFWEVLFGIVRKHEINEGFLVTGLLFALCMPPTIPLWQVAVGVSFGVVIGKEIFGGTGMNIMNPALVGRAFLFFSYPAQMSGDNVWVALDGVTKATPLAVVAGLPNGASASEALTQIGFSFQNMFLGFIPGSIGETSTLACLLGFAFLLITGVASWRIIVGCLGGLLSMSLLMSFFFGSESLAFYGLAPHWHVVMGGFAFGAIFMATDPVSAAASDTGRWIYGFLIGALVVLIRVVNPAYPEGMMLAILLMNVFAPLIDHFVVEAHIRGRAKHG